MAAPPSLLSLLFTRAPRLRSLDGARAVVTGAGSGLGAAVATQLAAAGATVHLVDLHGDRVATLAARLGPAHRAHTADVSDAAAVAALAATIQAEGPVDLLVNNAGIAAAGAAVDTTVADWRRVVDVNLMGVVHGVHAFGPAMRARGRGHIVNIASAAGLTAVPLMSAYTVTKGAVVTLSEALALEMAPHGVGVSVVCPGFVRTRLMAEAPTPLGATGVRTELAHTLSDLPWRDPEDVAEAVLSAVRWGRRVVPVYAEGWALRVLERLAPGLLRFIKRAMLGRSQR